MMPLFFVSFILLAQINPALTLICGTAIPLFGFLIGKVSIPIAAESKRRQEQAAVYKVYNMQRTLHRSDSFRANGNRSDI